MAQLLLGKEVTASLNEEIRRKVAQLNEQGVTPKLGIIRIGEREDDISYERGATKRCETLGVAFEKFLLPADASEEEVLKVIQAVNEDDSIHGVLLFRPLPRHLNEDKIVNALAVDRTWTASPTFPWRRCSWAAVRATPPAPPAPVCAFWTTTALTAPARRPW